MKGPFRWDSESWYCEVSLLISGDFTSTMLREARKAGTLRCSEPRRGHRFYKGAWLNAWLEASATPPASNAATPPPPAVKSAPAADPSRRPAERLSFREDD